MLKQKLKNQGKISSLKFNLKSKLKKLPAHFVEFYLKAIQNLICLGGSFNFDVRQKLMRTKLV